MKKPLVIIGSDHGGFELKEQLKKWLQSDDYQVEDVGAHSLDPHDDYPQFGFAVAKRVSDLSNQITQSDSLGIIICRSAGGVTIAANKVTGARAINIYDEQSAKHAKKHNDANIITLSGDWLTFNQAKELIKIFLNSSFENLERRERRIAQIRKFEEVS